MEMDQKGANSVDIAAEIAALRDGSQTLDEFVEKVGTATYAEPDQAETPTTAAAVWDRAEDRERSAPGTWQEVRDQYLMGRLTREEYAAVSARADEASGRKPTPVPGAAKPAEESTETVDNPTEETTEPPATEE